MTHARLAFIIPTHQRPRELRETLERLGALPIACWGPDPRVIVIDNASDPPAEAPPRLANGLRVELLRLDENRGAAARNAGAEACDADWLVMLDDDSSPLVCDLAGVLAAAPDDVAAIGGEITLNGGGREAGGLPEVFVGCGAAVRREAFVRLGGYDASFGYYAEEYDLCARLIADGSRVAHTRSIRFEHRKSDTGRDFARILARLVRNNAWVIRRYAPDAVLRQAMRTMLDRYRRIAERERVPEAFESAEDEARRTIGAQARAPLDDAGWDRFTGLSAARRGLAGAFAPGAGVRLVDRGKGDDLVERAAIEAGCCITEAPGTLELIGTLSPGPLLDALARRPSALAPWPREDRSGWLPRRARAG